MKKVGRALLAAWAIAGFLMFSYRMVTGTDPGDPIVIGDYVIFPERSDSCTTSMDPR